MNNYKLPTQDAIGIFGTVEKYESVIDEVARSHKSFKKLILEDRELDQHNPFRQLDLTKRDHAWETFYKIVSELIHDWCEAEFVPLGEHEVELMPLIVDDIWNVILEKY